jgi:hypothetical protein
MEEVDWVWMEYGWSMDGVWMEYGWSMDGVWMEYGWSVDDRFPHMPKIILKQK